VNSLLTTLSTELLNIALVVLLSVGTWGAKRLLQYLGLKEKSAQLDIDAKTREYLLAAADNGIEFALRRYRERVAAGEGSADAARNVLEDSAAYVIQRVPDALAHFGLDAAGVRQIIDARLPKLD